MQGQSQRHNGMLNNDRSSQPLSFGSKPKVLFYFRTVMYRINQLKIIISLEEKQTTKKKG